MVTVGDAENPSDGRYAPYAGKVDYVYEIGTYEITNAQYAEFLNAVGVTPDLDSNQLYNTEMTKGGNTGPNDGGIAWNDAAQEFQVDAKWANKPVNYVSFYDAARFCNWLTNGQLTTKEQSIATTESGVYIFSDRTTITNITTLNHATSTGYALPSHDEWYKAAYYNGDGTYRDYPVMADPIDTSVANYSYSFLYEDRDNNPVLADVKHYDAVAGAESYYKTYQQGGNVFEWTEPLDQTDAAHPRGGAAVRDLANLHANAYNVTNSNMDTDIWHRGFRVVYLTAVPEPQTYALFGGMALLGLTLLRRRKK